MAFSNKSLIAANAALAKADALRAELLAAGVLHAAATSCTVALASSTGIVGTAVNLTATPVGGGWPAGETLSPAIGGIAGTFSPQTASPAAGSTTPATFVLTPGAAGTGTVTVTASPSMGTPAGVQITVSAAPPQPVAPGQVTQLAAGTPGQTTVAVTYAAPAAGTAPITYAGLTQVGSAVAVANGGTFSATGGTFTGLAAGTAYTLIIKATNSAGSSTTVLGSTVTTAAAQPTPTPTPAPTPVNGAVLHSFNLVNWGTASSIGMARQGVPFVMGAVPAGSSVQVQRAGAVVAAQFNERRTWPDGSLAFTVMHIRDTPLAAGVRQSYNLVLVLGTPFTDTATTTPDQIAAGHAFSMTFANHTSQNDTATTAVGSGTSTASLATHMAVATRREMHHIGAVCDGATCWGMAQDATGGAVDAHLKTIWHVDRWKNQDGTTYAVEVGCEPAQDWWSVPGKTRRNYDASLMDGGTTIASYTGVPHMYNSHWLTVQNAGGNNRGRRHWVGGACPTLAYEPDRAYWIAAGYVPPLNLSTPRNPVPTPGDRSGNAVYQPISSQEHRPAIDGTGAYLGRGVIPNSDAMAFLSQSAPDMAAARVNAMAGLHVFYHHRSNRQRTRPGEAADTANTVVAFDMRGPAGTPAYDFTAQGMPVPVFATADGRTDPAQQDGYVRPTGGRIYWDTSYGDGNGDGNQRSDDASHAVNYSYFMYLLEGERYYMEATCDLAMNTLHQCTQDGFYPPVIWDYNGTRWGGVAQVATGEERNTGWAQNQIGCASGIVPDAHPANSYFKRLALQQGLYFQATLDGMPPDMKMVGIHPWTDSGGVMAPWMLAFNPLTCYHSWRLNGVAGIKAWADYIAQWSINNTRSSIYTTRFYRASNTHQANPGNIRSNPYLPNCLDIDAPIANASAATGLLTVTGGYVSNDTVLYPEAHNYATASMAVPPELKLGQAYYTRNVTTTGGSTTFALSASPGGAAITFAADRTNIGFLQDYITPVGRGDTISPSALGINADDYAPMHHAVLTEAYLSGHPQMTPALLNKSKNFNSVIQASALADWATWDYDVPAGQFTAPVAATTLPPVVPNLRPTYNAADLFWVRWDMPANMGTAPLFKLEVSGDGGSTYTVVQASTPLLACQIAPGPSAPRSQTVRVTAINDAGPSATPATLAVTMTPVKPASFYTFSNIGFGPNGNYNITVAFAADNSPVASDVLLGLSNSASVPPNTSAYQAGTYYNNGQGGWTTYIKDGYNSAPAGTYYIWAQIGGDAVDRLAGGPFTK